MDPKTKRNVVNGLMVLFIIATIWYFVAFGQAEMDSPEEDSAFNGCCASFILFVILGVWAKKLQDADKLEKEFETARNMQDAEKERLRVEKEAEKARKDAEKEAEKRRLRKEIEELEEALL